MKNFVWCTDIHLDFVDQEEDSVLECFAEPLSRVDCDGVFLTGDISLSDSIVRHLKILDNAVGKPIYFVCGNHDFYGSSFGAVRNRIREICKSSKNLRYLTQEKVIDLTENTAIVGHDGWYDVRHGNVSRSDVVMSDWFKISDYSDDNVVQLMMRGFPPIVKTNLVMEKSRGFADIATEHVTRYASLAAKTHSSVVVLTHVPPWPLHNASGKTASPDSHPWYTSKVMGDALEKIAASNKNTRFDVFCGHTHGLFDAQISNNLYCHVGGAEYGLPRPVGMIQVP